MKTNSLRGRNLSIYAIIGLVGLLASSCGSYKNSSYYDNDGVYGSSERPNKYAEENVAQSNKYKEYFGSNKDQYSENGEVFTDVEGYTSQSNDSVARNNNENNAGWGDNNQNVTVNYYTSPWYSNYGWGWNYPYSYYNNFGWGWNSYYGSSWSIGFGWGWNSPYYGWGWNYPYYGGYYYPYYGGYYGHHHHVGGTRGGYAYNGDRYGNYPGRRGTAGTYGTSPRPSRPSTFNNPRGTSFDNPRGNTQSSAPRPRFNPTRNTTEPRSIQQQDASSNPRPSLNQPRPRSESSSPRSNNNYSSPRSSSNSGFSSPRSSGGSFGGGNSGGGRSGGGRR